MSAVLAKATAARQIPDDLAEAGPWPMPIASSEFNDDDVYVYDAVSKQLLRALGCKSIEAWQAKSTGLRLLQGQAWATGLTAKSLQLWRPL